MNATDSFNASVKDEIARLSRESAIVAEQEELSMCHQALQEAERAADYAMSIVADREADIRRSEARLAGLMGRRHTDGVK